MGIGLSSAGAAAQSTLASSSQSTVPQAQPSTASPPRIGAGRYGRDTGLRSSVSVPVFGTYWKAVPPPGIPAGPKAFSVPPPLSPSQLPKEGSLHPRAPTVGRTGNGGGNLLPGNHAPSPRWWSKGGASLGLVALAVGLLYLGYLLGRMHQQKEALQFAIVIDGGSTGTRAHVYSWVHSPKEPLPVMVKPTYERNIGAPLHGISGQRLYKRVETEPGLDKMLHNDTGVRDALVPLLDWARKQIPTQAHRSTHVFLFATAGLRRLPREQREWILDKAWSILQKSPFRCRRDSVKVITGVEEAYYGWIALNYNFGKLGHTPKLPNFGALDLGGSSFQVTFEPDKAPVGDYGVNLSIGTTEHHLYAVSHTGFGLNDAFEKSVVQLLRHSPATKNGVVVVKNGQVEVEHPCLHKGYRQPFACSTHCMLPPLAAGEPYVVSGSPGIDGDNVAQVELKGAPNWEACQSLVELVINSSQASSCHLPPCALGKHQPAHQGKFYGLAGFFVVNKFFGLSASTSLEELLQKGQEFCELSWQDAQLSVPAQPGVDRYCFRAPYVVALLRYGLQLRDDQIVIGSGDFAWTLGAALFEANALRPSQSRPLQSGLVLFTNSRVAMTMGVLLLLLLILVVVMCYLGGMVRPWRRTYLPLFNPPSGGSGVSNWMPLSLRAQGRLSSLPVGGTGRISGEGGLKMPHSPVPSRDNYHNQVFGSGGSPGPLAEREGLQVDAITVGASPDRHQMGSVKMHHKGTLRLQNRRTQSREDLSYNELDIKSELQYVHWKYQALTRTESSRFLLSGQEEIMLYLATTASVPSLALSQLVQKGLQLSSAISLLIWS